MAALFADENVAWRRRITRMSQVEREELEQFRTFIDRYYRSQVGRLAQRCPNDQRSLEVHYDDLYQFDPGLADRYIKEPADVRKFLEEVLRTMDLPADVSLGQANARIHGLDDTHRFMPGKYSPTDEAGELRALEGEIARATEVFARITEAAFECQRCGTMTYIPQVRGEFQDPHECQGCERQGPFWINHDQSEFVDAQILELRTPPEHAEGEGQGIEVDLQEDLCGQADVGDRVEITGHLHIRQRGSGNSKSARFEQYLEAHHVSVDETDHQDLDIDAATRERVEELANGAEGDPLNVAAASLAPKVHGYETIKKMAVLSTVGGVHVQYPTGDADRGTVNLLLLGDPGTAKSKIIERVEELGWRTVGVSGKGATVAGVTATAVQDDLGTENGQWTLKAGALVRAHRGTVAIDELDDMPPDVRSALLEPMSKQHINVTKGGINTKLQTRTAVVAAGNPSRGRFDPHEELHAQFPFESNLTSRFDLVFTVTDRPDPDRDEEIADHILRTRDAAKSVGRDDVQTDDADVIDPPVDPPTLRAWIALAKRQPDPVFADDSVRETLKQQFTELRGMYDYDDSSPVPVTFRKLEAVIRVAEAAARFEFSAEITERHAKIATEAVGESMRDYQTDPETGQLDADVVETGTSHSQRERIEYVRDLLVELGDEHEQGRVPRLEVVDHHEDLADDPATDVPDLDAEMLHATMDQMQKKGMAVRFGDGDDARIKWMGETGL